MIDIARSYHKHQTPNALTRTRLTFRSKKAAHDYSNEETQYAISKHVRLQKAKLPRVRSERYQDSESPMCRRRTEDSESNSRNVSTCRVQRSKFRLQYSGSRVRLSGFRVSIERVLSGTKNDAKTNKEQSEHSSVAKPRTKP